MSTIQTKLLGKTGISASRLCFGTLTIGPLQSNLPLERGAEILAYAIQKGISFFDTAQLYGTYPYLKRAMEITGRYDITIASKTYAYTRELAQQAVEQARRELNRDVVDLFLLHEQESVHTLRGHREALDYLYDCKAKGIIRAVGASMHHVEAVLGAVQMGLDVIHPIYNQAGLGIVDGTREDMSAAIVAAHKAGIGVYSMKPLGGGNLFSQAEQCLRFVLEDPWIDCFAIGMQCEQEIDANLAFCQNGRFTAEQKELLDNRSRTLLIQDWCEGCGACVRRCGQGALTLADNQAVCDHTRCILCGYCAAVCPQFCIKVI